MALDYDHKVPAASHSWCSDCEWKAEGPWSHVQAKAHSDDLQHLVHLFVPD